MFKPDLVKTVIRFGVVGGLVMLAFTGLNWLLAPLLGTDPAFIVAYVPAVILHFCLNKWWTFGCKRNDTSRQVGAYLLMVGVTFLIQAAVFKLLTHFTSMPSWQAAALANVAQMAVTFVVMQRRIFVGSATQA